MIHSASLIHDDVIDQSFSRRGKPSVNVIWNHKKVSTMSLDDVNVCDGLNWMEFRVKISSAVVITCDSGAWFAFNWPLQLSHKVAKLFADWLERFCAKETLVSDRRLCAVFCAQYWVTPRKLCSLHRWRCIIDNNTAPNKRRKKTRKTHKNCNLNAFEQRDVERSLNQLRADWSI